MRVILLLRARVSESFRRLSNLNPTAEPENIGVAYTENMAFIPRMQEIK